jgi:RimJ/RimL family protein N-acetyltransferase
MTTPQPARGLPRRDVFQGRTARLEPLDEARHGAALWQAVQGEDSLWSFMAYGPWRDETSFRAWLKERQTLADPLYFAVVDTATGEAAGCVTLMRFDQPNGVIEVGHIFFSPRLQRTPAASESIYLLARHVFDDLGYRRFEWKCDEGNRRSKHAALRFGFSFEGVFRQHMIIKGRNRDTAWFSMLDSEWPMRSQAFERWLAAENFDDGGYQRLSLSALNGVGVS